MNRDERLKLFERERRHLLSLAFRILGSQPDAEDVVQETWIRYDGSETSRVQNVPAWLTTVSSRLCVDLLRRRRDIPQEPSEVPVSAVRGSHPEETALLAGELTTAFTIVLNELTPPQRVALVLHDAFGVPFDDIAHILGTTLASTKKLASRARARVRGRIAIDHEDNDNVRPVVEAFLQAAQDGNSERLAALLDPDVIRIADPHVLPPGGAQRVQGAQAVLDDTIRFRSVATRAHVAGVDGRPGIVLFAGRDLQLALVLRIANKRVVQFEVIADPQRLRRLKVT